MLNKDSFIKLMPMTTSVRETHTCTNYSTAQLVKLNSQVSYRNQISNLQTLQILTSQSLSSVTKRKSTVIFISTLSFLLGDPILTISANSGTL